MAVDNPRFPFHCPTCGQPLRFLADSRPGVYVYTCAIHGSFNFSFEGGAYGGQRSNRSTPAGLATDAPELPPLGLIGGLMICGGIRGMGFVHRQTCPHSSQR